MSRQILSEILWLTISWTVTFLVFLLFIGSPFADDTVDLHLYDTMFVIPRLHIFVTIFFVLSFIIYLVKETRNSFRKPIANSVLIILGITLVVLFSMALKIVSLFSNDGWTLYPPLSALGADEAIEIPDDKLSKYLGNFLTLLQVLVILVLLFVSYRCGKEKGRM